MKKIEKLLEGLFQIKENRSIFFESNTSIYCNIRPLLIVCKIFVILPIRNITGELSDVTFNWKSWEAVSTILFYPCAWLLGLTILHNNKEPLLYHMIPIAVRHTLSNICFSCACKTMIKLLKSIDKFDKLVFQFNSCREDKRIKTYKYLWAIFAAFGHLLAVVAYLSLYNLHDCIRIGGVCNMVLTYFIRTQVQIQAVLFVFLSYELSIRFNNLDMISEQFLQTSIQYKNSTRNYNRELESCRLLYKELTDCVRIFNDVFGFRMVVIFANFIFDAVNAILAALFFHEFYDGFGAIYTIQVFVFFCAGAAGAGWLQKSVCIVLAYIIRD